MKKLLCVFLSAVMLFGMAANTAFAESETAVNATELELYYLESRYESVISVPDEFPTSFQLEISGAENAVYEIISGDTVTVDENGLVEPKLNVANLVNGGQIYYYTAGTSVIRAAAGSEIFEITVDVKDYAEYYVDELINGFIDDNLTDSMTDYEKLDKTAQFVSSYSYSANYSSDLSLFIIGEGDCWAFAYAFIRVAERVGFDAWIRNGNRDLGAGNGHKNAMAQLPDGSYYEVECSYGDGDYYVKARRSLFSYRTCENGIEVYQYDGKTAPQKLSVPQEIDGRTVVSIGDDFVVMNEEIEEVVLPDTVTSIGESAFNSCLNLKKINLPSALTQLGLFAFTYCPSLTEITSASPNFTAENAVIYNADKSVLLFAPTVTSLEIPATVTEVAEYSFYYNKDITSVKIPSTVKFIGEGAFGDCSNLAVVQFEGSSIEEIDDFGFANCRNLTKIELPMSINRIGANAFMGCQNLTDIYCEAEVLPDGWDEAWLGECGATVHWGYVPSETVGDVDGNGKIEADDYITLKRIFFGVVKTETLLNAASADLRCDVDRNGKIEADDYIILKRAFFGIVKLG